MKRCLACGEQIYGDIPMHPPCMKKVFDADYLPAADFSVNDLHAPLFPPGPPDLQLEKFSISEIQAAAPVSFLRREKRLEPGGKNPAYFLKLPVDSLKDLPQNQNFCMSIASRLDVPSSPNTLITLRDNTPVYLVRRCGNEKDRKLRCKSFTQILGKENKHDGTLEEIGEKIKRISEIPGLDVQLFFEMVMLSFILGHGDLHLDKFSVLYDEKKIVRLAPLEDMASTKLFRPDEPDFALPMMGKTTNITGGDFQEFARFLKIYPKSYDKMFMRFFKGKRLIGRRIKHSALDIDMKLTLSDIVNERFKRLLQ